MKHKYIKKSYMQKTDDFIHIINNTNIENIDYRSIFDGAVEYAYNDSKVEYNESQVDKLMVNYIRHSLSNYDSNLRNAKMHRTIKDYNLYKNSVLDKISYMYPFLRDECNKQKEKVNMVNICRGG